MSGGADLALTAKSPALRGSPADRAGLERMDYVTSPSMERKCLIMTQPEITKRSRSRENPSTGWKRNVHRAELDEIWPPELAKNRDDGGPGTRKKNRRMGMDYILEAMQHGCLCPALTTSPRAGSSGSRHKQYNNPIDCYSDGTIEDMREESYKWTSLRHCWERKSAANARSTHSSRKGQKFDPSVAPLYYNRVRRLNKRREVYILCKKQEDKDTRKICWFFFSQIFHFIGNYTKQTTKANNKRKPHSKIAQKWK